MEALRPEGVAIPSSPYSSVVVSGDLVYTAGQVGQGPDGVTVPGGFETQCRQVLDNLRACLRAAGCELSDVIKVNAYLTDLANFPLYNEIYREYFSEPFPARTTVGAPLAADLLVEIEAVARRPA
jgi:2-iminobutanoate/2-iminopropanoate deaminase